MFLIGGPAFSGTTLLTLLLNQGTVLCLDEPDIHNPEQSHRGIPFLQDLFPDRTFPARPTEKLSYEDATVLLLECERAIEPYELGMKTCDWPFVGYAEAYRRRRYPVVAIVRDIRDVLVRPLPEWLDEAAMNVRYRLVWQHLSRANLWVRYEELVADPAATLARVTRALGLPVETSSTWTTNQVHRHMFKNARHDLLRSGSISSARLGIWRSSGLTFTDETHETARMMGYKP